MLLRVAAALVLVLHLGFIVFSVAGGLLAFRHRRVAWLHLPAAAWAFYVEAVGRACPLTGLENELRHRAGEAGYAQGFVEHYLLACIYPSGLTHPVQEGLAIGVVVANSIIYTLVWRSWRRSRLPPTGRA